MKYIIIGIKEDSVFYISNTHPIIWSDIKSQAKIYAERFAAEYTVLRDYDNYRYLKKQIESGIIDEIFLSIRNKDNEEIRRVKLL